MAANLPLIGERDASPIVAFLYEQFRRDFGRPQIPGILQCFATHPPLLEHMMGLAQSMLFLDGALDRRHKEMISAFGPLKTSAPIALTATVSSFAYMAGHRKPLKL